MGWDIFLIIILYLLGLIGLIAGFLLLKRPKDRGISAISVAFKGRRLTIDNSRLDKRTRKVFRQVFEKDDHDTSNSKEKGSIVLEVLLLVIPGIIALLFASTFIYLLVENKGNPNYQTPGELRSAMTTIIGYYFGIGAATAVSKGKKVTIEELYDLLQKEED